MGLETVLKSTIINNLCIGCGICRVACPTDAIAMKYTDKKEFVPEINNDKCIDCGQCVEFCPNTKEKLENESKKISSVDDPHSFGLKNASYILANDTDLEMRKKSASGGFVSALAIEMIKKGHIDYIIHANMKEGKKGDLHYGASISENIEEINNKRSSFYFPIEYSEIIKRFKGDNKNLLIIGVPCAIRGFTKLFTNHKDYNNNQIDTVALACSHNVNGQFVDFLADSFDIGKNKEFKCDLRNKDNIQDANNFNNHFFNDKKTISKVNRFDSLFTKAWRNYFFSMNVCNYCSDFWGYKADLTVKDAWGKWSNESPLGHSMVVIRNEKTLGLVKESKNINYENLDYETVRNSQLATTEYKQKLAFSRLNNMNIDKLKGGFLSKKFFSKSSKLLYKKFGFFISKNILFVLLFFVGSTKKGLRLVKKLMKARN